MKPNFALNLSLDGIDLLHRGKSGWQPVGTVSLDDPDIGAGLAMLRQTAVALESGGMTTKVIIPDSQILYTELEVDTDDPATRDANIRRALEGMTPYAAKDLVFDWRREGGKVRLAVLARETVVEAETFAREHRFNPVSFVAAPQDGQFPGEPFFGAAASAGELLRGLGPVEPDDRPIDLEAVRRARQQAKAPAAPEEPAPEPPGPTFSSRRDPARRAEAPQAAQPEPAPQPAEPASPPPAAETPPPSAVQATPPEPAAPAARADRPPPPRLVASTDEPPPPHAERDGLKVTSPRAVPDPDQPRTAPRAPAAVRPFVRPPEPPRRSPVVDFGNRRVQTAQAALATAPELRLPPEPDLPPAPPAPVLRLGSMAEKPAGRRSPAVVVLLTLVLLVALAALALWSTFWTGAPEPEPVAIGAVEPAPPEPEPAVAAVEPSVRPLPRPVLVEETPEETPVDSAAAPLDGGIPPEPEAAPDPEPAALPAVPAPILPEDPAVRALGPAAALPPPPADSAAAATFDPAEPAPTALTDAGEAAAEVELTAPPLADDPAEAAISDADLEADVAALPDGEAEIPGVDDEALADGEPEALLDPVPDTPALPQDPVTELVPTDAGAAERVRQQLVAELTPEVAERRYAETGVWVLPLAPPAEPRQDRTDDIYVAAVDSQIDSEDAVALPKLAPDRAILSPLPPPAAGTVFDFDERGLVRATPEGAVNPDGIPVYLGRPPLAPKPRPGTAAAPEAPGLTGDAPAADPAPKPGVRPRARPGDLSETNQKALLGGRTLAELSRLKPRHRPEAVVTLAAAGALVTPAVLELAPATKLAVAQSRQPKRRPAEIVAVAAAARVAPPPVPAAPPPQDDTAVAEADNEPVVEVASAAVMPKLPTKAGVAKTATVANAINLSKINLIGVYGSSSQRRALVRMPNGKYVKVKVGDRIDGGKVAAIGEAELVYVKGSRQVKLALPKT